MDASTHVFEPAFWDDQMQEIGHLNNLLFQLHAFVACLNEELRHLNNLCSRIEDNPASPDKPTLLRLFESFKWRKEQLDPLHCFSPAYSPSTYFNPALSTHQFALPLLDAAMHYFHDEFVTSTAAIEKRVKAILKEPEETYPDVSF